MMLFHGTTLNRLEEILKVGYLGSGSPVWDASMPNTTYFWTEDYMKLNLDIDEDDDESYYSSSSERRDAIKSEGISYGAGASEFALSQELTNLKRVVLIFDSDDLDKLETDDSCNDVMKHCMQYRGKIPVNLIKEVWMDKEPLDIYAFYFIGLAESRKYMFDRSSWSSLDACHLVEGKQKLSDTTLKGALDFYEAICEDWYHELNSHEHLILYEISQSPALVSIKA